MPLFSVSANIQSGEPGGRKRSLDEYADDLIQLEGQTSQKNPSSATASSTPACLPSSTKDLHQPTPNGSPALTEAGSSTPRRKSVSPETPTKSSAQSSSHSNPSGQSPSSTMANAAGAKRKRMTQDEKDAKEREAADKKKEREEKAAVKAAEKVKQDEEKAARTKEREDKRKKKEEEDRIKAEQRDEKRRKKEEEQQRIQDEKDKKVRAQPRLSNYFTSSPRPDDRRVIKLESPSKGKDAGTSTDAAPSAYDTMFQPFYLKENTRMGTREDQMDSETRKVKAGILEDFVSGKRSLDASAASFDPVELFSLPSRPARRGRLHHPVRHIMKEVYKEAGSRQGGNTIDTAEAMKRARNTLAKVPMKVIAFSQDVRPPYYGTMTFKPFALGRVEMAKAARNSAAQRLPLVYEYDSEAEWQEEEGEDLDIDDDESDADDEDDMDEFLDDSEDAGLARRVFGTTMEPNSTGICFEDEHKRAPNRATAPFRMEIMQNVVEFGSSIDPFTTSYWEPEPMSKPVKSAAATETCTKMAPPPPPANAFAALKGNAGSDPKPEKMVPGETLNEVKGLILNNKTLSKAGMVDFVFQQVRDKASRLAVKNTIEYIAEKKGEGRSKEWTLKPGHGIVSV